MKKNIITTLKVSALALTSLLLVSCGGKEPEPNSAGAAALKAQKAVIAGDEATYFDCTNAPDMVKRYAPDMPELKDTTVEYISEEVSADGEKATVTLKVKNAEGSSEVKFDMVKKDGQWLINLPSMPSIPSF